MKDIESESKFLLKFIFHILLTPFVFIAVLFKKKEAKDLLRPIKDIFTFLFEPKITISLVIITSISFIVSLFLSESILLDLIKYPTDLFSTKIYTLITYGFLHANKDHLIGNMIGLYIFGRVIEKNLGSLKTFFVYFSSLIIAGIFESIINLLQGNNTGTIGASGAVMGLIACAILLNPFYITYELVIPMPILFVGWLSIYLDLIGIFNTTSDGIAHFAHVGGFMSITLLAYFFSGEDQSKLKKGLILNSITFIVVGILVFVLV